jgi:hypothetical protein
MSLQKREAEKHHHPWTHDQSFTHIHDLIPDVAIWDSYEDVLIAQQVNFQCLK